MYVPNLFMDVQVHAFTFIANYNYNYQFAYYNLFQGMFVYKELCWIKSRSDVSQYIVTLQGISVI